MTRSPRSGGRGRAAPAPPDGRCGSGRWSSPARGPGRSARRDADCSARHRRHGRIRPGSAAARLPTPDPRSGPGRGRAGISSAGSATMSRWPFTPRSAWGRSAASIAGKGERKSPISTSWAWRGKGRPGGRLSDPAASAASSSRAMRSTVARLAEGRQIAAQQGHALAGAQQQRGQRQGQHLGPLALAGQAGRRMPIHGGAGIAPEPDALGRGPFGLAQEEPVGFRGLAPVDAGGGLARLILTELPEGIAGADAPAAMHALLDRGRHPQGGDQQRRQARCQALGLAPRRLLDRRRPARSLSWYRSHCSVAGPAAGLMRRAGTADRSARPGSPHRPGPRN